MTDVYLGLGSNLGERAEQLDDAVARIAQLDQTSLLARSAVYETPPMGPQDQGAYLNMAVRVQTALSARALMQALHQIEDRLGREPAENRRHWGPRLIDIDLLLYGDEVIDEPALTVPHSGLHERWFVLRPLADLNPQVLHPVLGKTAGQLLADVEAAGVAQGAAV